MNNDFFYLQERKFGLNSLFLKIIATFLMTLDHYALLFLQSNSNVYYILRAIGKISFPIFAYLAFESTLRTKHIKKYLITLFSFSLFLDIFGYIFGAINNITISSNPFIGNVFTDLFLGVLTIYLLKIKSKFSFLAIIPIVYALLSNVIINDSYGTLFKTDWGSFSITFFLLLYFIREIYHIYLINKANQFQIDKESLYESTSITTINNVLASLSLLLTELLFYLIYMIDNTTSFIPNEYVPIGTYSTLAIIFILLFNGKRGKDNKIIRYSFYIYYPLHLIIFGIISLFFGTLSAL